MKVNTVTALQDNSDAARTLVITDSCTNTTICSESYCAVEMSQHLNIENKCVNSTNGTPLLQ